MGTGLEDIVTHFTSILNLSLKLYSEGTSENTDVNRKRYQ